MREVMTLVYEVWSELLVPREGLEVSAPRAVLWLSQSVPFYIFHAGALY